MLNRILLPCSLSLLALLASCTHSTEPANPQNPVLLLLSVDRETYRLKDTTINTVSAEASVRTYIHFTDDTIPSPVIASASINSASMAKGPVGLSYFVLKGPQGDFQVIPAGGNYVWDVQQSIIGAGIRDSLQSPSDKPIIISPNKGDTISLAEGIAIRLEKFRADSSVNHQDFAEIFQMTDSVEDVPFIEKQVPENNELVFTPSELQLSKFRPRVAYLTISRTAYKEVPTPWHWNYEMLVHYTEQIAVYFK